MARTEQHVVFILFYKRLFLFFLGYFVNTNDKVITSYKKKPLKHKYNRRCFIFIFLDLNFIIHHTF